MAGNGGYVFISHSHKDINKVRVLRNLMEENGFEPLCFFLKCLTENDEIEDLIKREIDSREWFVFVNSPNSQQSEWVSKERNYIMSSFTKSIITVDVDEINENIVNKIMKTLRVFISYSHKDARYMRELKKALIKKDLKVFTDEDIDVGDIFTLSIHEKIKEAAMFGCIIHLYTSDSLSSQHVHQELMAAIKYDGIIVPVIIGNEDDVLIDSLPLPLKNLKFCYLGKNPTGDDYDECVDTICSILVKKFNG